MPSTTTSSIAIAWRPPAPEPTPHPSPSTKDMSMSPITRRLASIALAAAGLATTLPAAAQEWPTRPVRIIPPFPAGAGPEAVVRVLADKLQRKWGQPVVVENKPGGNGFIAI